MKILRVKQFSLLACLSIAVFACSKDDKNQTPGTDDARIVELSSQKAISDAYYDDVSAEVIQINTENGLTNQSATQQAGCATISVSPKDSSIWPKTVSIDYGTTGCIGLNGYVRKGKISYTIDKKLLTTGAKIIVNFDNYSVNGYKLEGVYTITNNGSANGLNVTVVLTNGKVTHPDGKWYTRTSTTNWVQSAGMSTLSILDDEYNLTGNGTITSSEGNTLTGASKTNLLRKVSCVNTVSGLLDLTYNNIAGVLDFGNGECDKAAVITIAGKQYNVTLP
jgi:hypothetical protein